MKIRIISSLEKCFEDERIAQKRVLEKFSMLRNERYSFQLAYQLDLCSDRCHNYLAVRVEVDGPLKDRIRVRKVNYIPALQPTYIDDADSGMLRTSRGLYPDALTDLEDGHVHVMPYLNALWLDVEGDETLAAGEYPITVRFVTVDGNTHKELPDEPVTEATVTAEVIGADLPKQTTKVTQWFHCDSLMSYYDTEAFDEKHWRIIENFMAAAVKNGINMILTPLFTPPLDTAIGGERATIQLVDITVTNGEYSFDFSRLQRWIDLCDKVGVEYFEINHMFTQWGCVNCPKVMATVDGEYRRIFGWDTAAAGPEYKKFLGVFIPAFLGYMKSVGCDKRCWFHISDEPNETQMDSYSAAREILVPLIEGYPVIDALSEVEFFDKGLVPTPVPINSNMAVFLDRDIKDRWTYYCCGHSEGASNRFFCMPTARTRIMGTQMYKYNVKGFLQWGYNFYFNQFSHVPVNPWNCSDGDGFAPAGDCYSVYPGRRGECVESLRLKAFYDGLQDQRAMELCESLYGKEFVVSMIDEGIEPLTFNNFHEDSTYLLGLRERVNAAIKAAVAEKA